MIMKRLTLTLLAVATSLATMASTGAAALADHHGWGGYGFGHRWAGGYGWGRPFYGGWGRSYGYYERPYYSGWGRNYGWGSYDYGYPFLRFHHHHHWW